MNDISLVSGGLCHRIFLRTMKSILEGYWGNIERKNNNSSKE